jgi:hypothetical protein
VVRLALLFSIVLGLARPALAAGETTVTDAPPRSGVALELLPDCWPALPRVLGYEYNQKNHHETPGYEEGQRPPPDEPASSSKRKRWRVVGVLVRCGEAFEAQECRLVQKTKGATQEPVKLKLGPAVELLRFFVVKEDPARPVRFELLGPKGDAPIATLEETLKPGGRTTANPYDARFVAAELNNEQRVREGYPFFPVAIRVMNDVEKPIAGARLTLLHDQFGLIETAEVDEDGRWQGRLLGGAWTAIAFGVPKEDPGEKTVLRNPRVAYLVKSFDVSGGGAATVVEMRADQSARVKAVDADGSPVALERLTVMPHKVAEAMRFADVHDRCAQAFAFDLDAKLLSGTLDLLTNKGASYDLAALVRPGEGVTGFLHASGFTGEGALPLVFAPSKMARYVFDPPTGFGGGRSIRGRLTLLEAERQSFDFGGEDLQTIYAPAGAVRIEMTYAMRNGDELRMVPRRIDGKPGALYDCTPRPPFNMGIFAKNSRGIQIFIAIQDGAGQLVQSLKSQGTVKAFGQKGEPLFELPLSAMAFMFPTSLEKVDITKVALEAHLRIGSEWLRGRPQIEMVRKTAGHGTWAIVPRLLEAQADAFLQMVEKSCAGEKKYVGGPPGPVGMDFQIFLPPGVGGLGGGGVIQLEISELLPFVHETDRLPGAYCHELGHNVGFDHSPIMLLAPTGVQEGMYGPLGYRMVNGAALDRLFAYLQGRRHEDKGTWTLGGDVFGGLRLIFGPDAHRKMFEARHGFDAGLKAGGLSSIERIATEYSIALDQNVAWVFRAYGWPVFDFRVAWGRSIALTHGKGVEPINADAVQIAAIRRWWVEGPFPEGRAGKGGDGAGDGEGSASPGSSETAWRPVTWPTDFIALDQGRPPAEEPRQHRLFARVVVPQNTIAYAVAASDVALEIAVNGHPIARLDASPQLFQPVHDELMLDRKRAFPVLLMAGENTIDVDALQPPGSKGFILGLVGQDGKPLAVRLRPEGPDLDGDAPEEKKLRPEGPVANPGFEDGGPWPAGWIVGPGEPALAVVPTMDGDAPAAGARSLRMTVTKPATGAVMQRVVVEPGAVYRVHAFMRVDAAWQGDAYVSLFTGDVNSHITRTEPAKFAGPRWVEVNGHFAAQKRRVVYVCCYVKAKAGSVWFDQVELIREK